MTKGDSVSCPFRFQGQYEDYETGLYYNRFRYYLPEEGIYLSKDPIGFNSGILNLYSYVSDPLNSIDPLGLAKMSCGDPQKLKQLGLEGVQLRGASFNAGKKRLEAAGFKLHETTETGRITFVHPQTGAQVHYDGTSGSLAGNQDPHWHIQDRGGQKYGETGLPADQDKTGGHIFSNEGNSQF